MPRANCAPRTGVVSGTRAQPWAARRQGGGVPTVRRAAPNVTAYAVLCGGRPTLITSGWTWRRCSSPPPSCRPSG